MRCPKCGYISFDYNQVCPKCNKNISAEQEKTFLPSFRPDPPSLLGFLIGEANESNINLRAQRGTHMDSHVSENMDLGDSAILDREDFNFEGQDLEMSLAPEDPGELVIEQERVVEHEKLFSDSDFNLEEKEDDEILSPMESAGDEESALDLGDLSLEESGDDLGDLVLDESKVPKEQTETEIEFDDANFSLDSLSGEIDAGGSELEPEIELNLDDLKVGDLGDLEIGTGDALEKELQGTLVEPDREFGGEQLEAEDLLIERPDVDLDNISDIPDIFAKDTAAEEKEKTIILSDFSLDEAESASIEGFEFDDVPLETSPPEDEALDLENFNLDLNDSGEMGGSPNQDDLSLNDSAELEKTFSLNDISIDEYSDHGKDISSQSKISSDSDEFDIDLDAMSLDVEEYQKKPASDKDDFILDLEDMDIDLDLNDPKK
jgi:hypothetical protein